MRGRTALMWAAFKGHHEIVDRLLMSLEAGNAVRVHEYIDAVDREGVTALMLAAMAGHTRVVQLLIAKGASLEKVNNAGFRVLSYAISARNVPLVRELLSKFRGDSLTTTELALAIARKCHECLSALLEWGAGRDVVKVHSNSERVVDPVVMAVETKDVEALKILASHGRLERELNGNVGPAALHLAAVRGDLNIVRILLGLGRSSKRPART